MIGDRTWRWAVPLVAAVLALAAPAVPAKDLGVRGATWPIVESDLLAQIEARLTDMRRSGELARLEDEARERVRRRLEEPDPVPGIAPARARRTRFVDPAIVVTQDIRGPDSRLIAAAGTRIDPFEHAPLTRALLFVDGRREVEVAWALARPGPNRIVLLAGRPLDLMRRHRQPFFFDLGGRLAERFAVRATPTSLVRDGMRLRLTEIPLGARPRTRSGDRPRREPESATGDCGDPVHRNRTFEHPQRRPQPC